MLEQHNVSVVSTVVTPDVHEDTTVVEPHPEWRLARDTWGVGWHIHTYGVGTCFLLLAMYAVIILVHLNRRLRHQPLVAYTTLSILTLGLSKVLVLYADPYSSTGALPGAVVQVLQGLTYPCLIAIFTLLELSIMRITRVHLGPGHTHNTRLLCALLLAHLALVVAIYLTVALHTNLKLLLLLSQAIFITWGLVLCFIFVYNGFKIAQFTNETSRVLQQIVAYSKVKKELSKNGNHRDLALHRIRKARIKETSVDTYPNSEASNQSHEGESSDSMCFFNEAHYELDEEKLEAVYRQRQQQAQKDTNHRKKRFTHRRHSVNTTNNNEKPKGPKLVLRSSSEEESEYITDTASTAGVISLEDQLLSQIQSRCLTGTLHSIGAARDGYQALSVPSKVFTNELALKHAQTTPDHTPRRIKDSANVGKKEPCTVADSHKEDCDLLDIGIEGEDNQECSGYMADTEHTSPKCKAKSKSSTLTTCPDEVDDEGEGEGTSPSHCPYPLPIRDNCLGLYRIRQGRVLRKVLKLTYMCTLFAFICCVLHLYAMFGVYGVLSNETIAQPWPWYVFMTCARLGELGVGWTSAWITHTLGSQRYRPARRHRRKHSLQLHNSTTC